MHTAFFAMAPSVCDRRAPGLQIQKTEEEPMQKLLRRALIGAALLAMILLISGCREVSASAGVRVMLSDGEGFTVAGENPVLVEPGGTAAFQIDMPEGYVCIQHSEGTVFDAATSTLYVTDVKYPRTVSMRVADNPEEVKFFLENSGNGGYVGSETEQGIVYAGTVARCYVRTKPEFRFDGWSLKHSLARGGELLSTDEVIDYTVTANTFLYANFTRVVAEVKPEDPNRETYIITYDAGEGCYAGTNVSVITFEMEKYHIYENCLPANDTFVREGYQLIEYNTEPDGSGQGYSLGSKIIDDYDPNEPIVLYCIWAKESDVSLFTWEESANFITITGYSGDEDTVVIPEKINGKNVTAVRAGAFVDKNFSTMVLPKTLLQAESGAFGCTSNFSTLYMFDNITNFKNNAFTDMSGLKNLRLNAAHKPGFTNSVEGCFGEKWERMVSSEKPVIVVMSGSSSLYGLNGAMLQSMVGEDYTVVNYGTNAGVSSVFYLEMISHFLDEDDIVIHAPEIGGSTMGATNVTWRLFRGTEYYFNVWRYVDMTRYTEFFSQLSEFNSYRQGSSLDYTVRAHSMNIYGDIDNTSAENFADYHAGSTIHLNPGTINGKNQENLNWVYQLLLDRGVTVYMSCAPCNYNAIPAQYRTDAAMDAYMAGIQDSVIIPVISHIKNYILPGEKMYNSDYHPNAYGRDDRTKQLYADLAAQMEKDGRPLPEIED